MTGARVRGAVVTLAIVGFGLAVGFGLRGTTSPGEPAAAEAPDPVALTSSASTFPDDRTMAAASDLVVVGTVEAVQDGRTITDPADPEAGIRTQLATLVVDDVLQGDDVSTVVVEQEAGLLDGTPVVVDGVAPLEVGDAGTWYLVAGQSDQFPYHALIGPQGFVADR